MSKRLQPHFEERVYVMEQIVYDAGPGTIPIVVEGQAQIQAEIAQCQRLVLDPSYPKMKGYYLVSQPLVAPTLGKLGLKFEAAGKVRVFAMVDPITQ
jgi:hypothetical protein